MTQQHQATLGYTMAELGYTVAEAVTALAPAELSGDVDLYLQVRREGRFWRYQQHLDILLEALINRAINNEVVFMGIKLDEFELTKIPIHFLIANPVQIVRTAHSQLEDAIIGPYHARFYGIRVFIAADLAPLPAAKMSKRARGKTGPKSSKGDAVTGMMLEALQTGNTTVDQLEQDNQEFLLEFYGKPHGCKSRSTVVRARDKALSLFVEDRNTDK